jgi:hypothetical protein
MRGGLRAIVGAVSVFAFSRVAEFLQTPLGRLQLYTGIVVLTAVAGFTAVLGLSGLTSSKRTSPAP